MSTDEDIRELRSRQEALTAASDVTTDGAGSLQNGVKGDSCPPVTRHASFVQSQAVVLDQPIQRAVMHITGAVQSPDTAPGGASRVVSMHLVNTCIAKTGLPPLT